MSALKKLNDEFDGCTNFFNNQLQYRPVTKQKDILDCIDLLLIILLMGIIIWFIVINEAFLNSKAFNDNSTKDQEEIKEFKEQINKILNHQKFCDVFGHEKHPNSIINKILKELDDIEQKGNMKDKFFVEA